MEIETQLMQLLMQVGTLAGGRGLIAESETIFEGIKAVRPQSEYPLIGMAITRMNDMDWEGAVRILGEEALAVNPQSDLAKGFLGLALMRVGLPAESKGLLKEVLDAGRDEKAVEMARCLLDEMNS